MLPVLLIAGFALVLYLPGSGWGTVRVNRPEVAHGWGVDDITPLGTLSELSGIRQERATRNLGYPLGHPLMLGAVYAPYVAYLFATGGLRSPSDTYPYGLADPEGSLATLALLGHLLSVLLAVGVVLAARDAASQLGGERAGVAAALFTALMFPMFYYSRTGNVDMPVLFFMALAFAAYARMLRGGFSRGRALAIGVAVGGAIATKEPAVAAFIGMPFVLLPLHWFDLRKSGARGFLRLPGLALLASLVVAAVGTGLLIDPERFFAHIAFARERLAGIAGGGVWFMEGYPRTLAGNLDLAAVMGGHLADSLTAPGLLLGVAGIGLAVRRSPRLAALVVPALTYLAVLFWSTRTSQLRYVMPPALILAIFAGFATHEGLGSRGFVRLGTGAVAIFALGLALLRGIDLTHAMVHDSRYTASDWLEANAPETGTLAYFGASQTLPVVPPRLSIERANTYEGAIAAPRIGPEAVREIEHRWRSDPPAVILLAPDHSSPQGVEYSASVPPEIFDGLEDGSLGFARAELFQAPRLMPWVRRPALDYPVVNPPIRIYVPAERARGTTH